MAATPHNMQRLAWSTARTIFTRRCRGAAHALGEVAAAATEAVAMAVEPGTLEAEIGVVDDEEPDWSGDESPHLRLLLRSHGHTATAKRIKGKGIYRVIYLGFRIQRFRFPGFRVIYHIGIRRTRH